MCLSGQSYTTLILSGQCQPDEAAGVECCEFNFYPFTHPPIIWNFTEYWSESEIKSGGEFFQTRLLILMTFHGKRLQFERTLQIMQ